MGHMGIPVPKQKNLRGGDSVCQLQPPHCLRDIGQDITVLARGIPTFMGGDVHPGHDKVSQTNYPDKPCNKAQGQLYRKQLTMPEVKCKGNPAKVLPRGCPPPSC